MSSLLFHLPDFTATTLLHLIIIFGVALLLNRLLRTSTNLLIKPADSEARAAKAREQQTRTAAGVLYGAGSKLIWGVALLTAAAEIGINVFPVVVVVGVAALALGIGAHNLVRDVINGLAITLEDQYVAGDTVQIGETLGRVENITLRRTVIRDARGAVVSLSNGEIRTVANLSRDWSQTFVDVALSPQIPQEQALQALDAAAAELRGDPAWSQALVDGPRILGLQSFDQILPRCACRFAPPSPPGRCSTGTAPPHPIRDAAPGHSRKRRATSGIQTDSERADGRRPTSRGIRTRRKN